ncbi:pitrilysin family protein [Sinanaerobacter sp. ZZT-01]|uniref:M16 family metallopeptidase n=1 Tax=Sinanaerobacter sp. ZZT-01 TaxID=3111540 RepID=UPI002D76E5A1|nr:pitrilysin family protein [Sinanaerobacter sp. ZZT-01]WRR93219.1 pitrilysin family protein [Sinanaerobacter sp. ZZT-01]
MLINRILDCGIRVAMEKIPYVQSASIGIWVKAGSADENEINSGISHFIEHMLFKGTELRSAKEIASDVDKIGGHINAFTGKEATCYYLKTLDSNLEKGCEILLDMLLNSKFDPDEMAKERMVICEEMKMIEDSPDEYAQDLISEAVFHGTDLQSPIIGTEKSLMGIQRDDIMDYMGKEYTRDNIVISLAGNFNEDKVCEFLEGKLHSLNEKKERKALKIAEYKPTYLVKTKEIEQSHICLGLKGIELEHKLYYAMAVLNNIMGGSMSSRLFQNIREEKGLAYSVYSAAAAYVNLGSFTIYAGVSHNKVKDAIYGIMEELHSLKNNGITQEEFLTAKEQLKSNYIFGLENVNGRMFTIGKNTLLLGKVHTPEEVLRNISGVTMEQIFDTANIISDVKQYSAVLVGRKEVDLKGILQKS